MAPMTTRLACGLFLLLASGCAATPKGYTERDLQLVVEVMRKRCERRRRLDREQTTAALVAAATTKDRERLPPHLRHLLEPRERLIL